MSTLMKFARRRVWILSIAIIAAVSLVLVFSTAHSGASTSRSSRKNKYKGEYAPGDVLVRFRQDSALARETDRVSTMLPAEDGSEIPMDVKKFEGSNLVDGLRLAKVPADQTLHAIDLLNARSDVEFAEPNFVWHRSALPNDTQFAPSQWALKNTGQVGTNDTCSCQQAGTVGEDIDAEQAWNTTTGSSSVVVAVLDGGVDINHPDLQQNIWTNPGEIANDGIDNDGNGKIDDVNGWDFVHEDKTVFDAEEGDDHATHVAGIIGARGNNGQGVAGVNWQVQIMSVKVLGPGGGLVSDIISGYTYVRALKQRATNPVNVRVTNNSYGGPDRSDAAATAIQALNGAGILVVAAAGNEAHNNFNYQTFPADYGLGNIISVAATDRFGQLASFSNFGGTTVHIGAPGRGILSTVPNFFSDPGTISDGGGKYAFFSGTSMATPQVAGVAALAIAANPAVTLPQLRNAILYSGEALASLNGKTTTGKRLNALRTLQTLAENDNTAPAAATNLQVTGSTGRTITIQWTAPGDDVNTGTAADYDFFFTSNATSTKWPLLTNAVPAAAGTVQTTTLQLPFLGSAGTLELQTFDNAGNPSSASVGVNIGNNAVINPYSISLSTNVPLTTGGTALNLIGDDAFKENVALPFAFPYFGSDRTTVTVSSNGSLYFTPIPQANNGSETFGLDAISLIQDLQRRAQIAGLWDDLRTDHRAGGDVFMVSDANHAVFRWEGVTFGDGTPQNEFPVNFEIELRPNGLIIMRYGSGNTNIFPVVGISAGEPDAYVEPTHTSEFDSTSLTNAQTITFTPNGTAVGTIQFSGASFSIGEGGGDLLVTVNRSGDSTGAASVDYATSDGAAAQSCSTTNGLASSRCDYITTLGTINFAAGETTKTISVPIIDDIRAEGTESFTMTLTNAGGATLGAQSVATLTITDNEMVNGSTNPIDNAGFFVRQHYIDFLNREPDA
ncbi:MAG: S8 family serine peptidase, partial [Pyrinomonadaceae bacterium]